MGESQEGFSGAKGRAREFETETVSLGGLFLVGDLRTHAVIARHFPTGQERLTPRSGQFLLFILGRKTRRGGQIESVEVGVLGETRGHVGRVGELEEVAVAAEFIKLLELLRKVLA